MFQFGALSDQVNLFLLKTDDFLLLVIGLVLLHVLAPEVLRALQHLVNVLLFVDQVKPQLVLVVRPVR